jgi:hypothetical protein
MWLFTKDGHLSIGQKPFDLDQLIIHTQLREEIEAVVALLDKVGGKQHEILEMTEGDYQFKVMAQRALVAEAVAKLVADIDYDKFIHSFHVDFGAKPGFILWINKTGLQVATVRE